MSVFRMLVRAAGPLTLILASGGTVSAQTTATWAAAASNTWGTPAAWSPAVVPNNAGPITYNVFITPTGTPYTATLDLDVTINDLTQESADATLNIGTFGLNVLGDYTLAAPRLQGVRSGTGMTVTGLTTIGGSFPAPLLLGMKLFTDGGLTFNNSGVADICDTDVDHRGGICNWAGANINTGFSSTLRIGGGASFEINSDSTLLWDGTGTRTVITLEGTLRKATGAGESFFDGVTINNTGTLQVETGTLRANQIILATSNTLAGGTWNVLNGSALILEGQTVINNEATVRLSGAGATFAAFDSVSNNEISGRIQIDTGRNFTTAGTFTNDGALAVGAGVEFRVAPGSGLTNITGGTISGGTYEIEGTVRVDGANIDNVDSTITLNGPASAFLDDVGADALRNLDTIATSGDLSITTGRDFLTVGDLTVGTTGRLGVGAGSLFRVAPGFTLTNFAGGVFDGGIFDIEGTLQFDNADVNTVSADLTLETSSGRILDAAGLDGLRNLDTIATAGALTLRNGRDLTTTGTLAVNGSGRLTIGPDTVDDDTDVLINGDLLIDGGTVEVLGGTLTVTGIISQNGQLRGGNGGRIQAGLVLNRGELSPGGADIARMLIVANVSMQAGTELRVQIAGLTPGVGYDQLLVEEGGVQFGGATGTLRIAVDPALRPLVRPGDFFDVLVAANGVTGVFQTVIGLDGPGGLKLALFYLPDRVRLVVTEIPSPGGTAIVGPMLLVAARRRRVDARR